MMSSTDRATAIVERLGSRIAVSATPDELRHVERDFAPFLKLQEDDGGPTDWAVVADPRPAELDASFVRFERAGPGHPAEEVLVSAARRQTATLHPLGPWRVLFLERLVRHALRATLAEQQRASFLHAGLVLDGARGIAVAGPRRAGKTTTLLNLAVHHGLPFVSNDDLALVAGPDEVLGLGWPRSVRVRPDGLGPLGLAASAAASAHPVHRGARLSELTDDAVMLCSHELPDVLGVRLSAQGTVHAIVFPCFVTDGVGPSVRRIAPGEAREVLLANLQVVPDEPWVGYLRHAFRFDAGAPGRAAADLASRMPCFELHQSMAGARAAAGFLLEELRREVG